MKILIVDDEKWAIDPVIDRLQYEGYEVIHKGNCHDALEYLKESGKDINTLIIDNVIPRGKNVTFIEKKLSSSKTSGLELAMYAKKHLPNLNVIGFSILSEPSIIQRYRENNFWYFNKTENHEFLFDLLTEIKLKGTIPKNLPNIFIVHGHDEVAKLSLKNYLQNILKLGEPIILSEQPSKGRTIIEKFEEYAKDVNLVFVVLSPDDLILVKENGREYYQPRPNVIFELGYYYGKLNRKSGDVILLSKSPIQMPSDLSGIIYIDISNGIENSGESIRKEIKKWIE